MNIKYNPKPQFPKIEHLANPEYREEYEMPADYQRQAEQMLELIESRDEYARIMPTLPPEMKQEFLERIARLEATKLDDILEGKDQAETFSSIGTSTFQKFF